VTYKDKSHRRISHMGWSSVIKVSKKPRRHVGGMLYMYEWEGELVKMRKILTPRLFAGHVFRLVCNSTHSSLQASAYTQVHDAPPLQHSVPPTWRLYPLSTGLRHVYTDDSAAKCHVTESVLRDTMTETDATTRDAVATCISLLPQLLRRLVVLWLCDVGKARKSCSGAIIHTRQLRNLRHDVGHG